MVSTLRHALLPCAIMALLAPRSAEAYCSGTFYSFGSCGNVSPQIFVYINAGPDFSLARTGLSLEDTELLVNTMISSFNESGVTLPRLVYGGRVFHDTIYDSGKGEEDYKELWNLNAGGRPLGVRINAVSCAADAPDHELIAGNARAVRGHGFATIDLTPFLDKVGTVCQRAGEAVSCASVPADPDPSGTKCTDPDMQIECSCTEGPPVGAHKCQDPDDDDGDPTMFLTGCLCTSLGYDAYNVGDGQANPLEPSACRTLGERGTKDFLFVVMHEMGHVLGLGHNIHDTLEECQSKDGGSLFTSGDVGVMAYNTIVAEIGKGRRLYRDDIEALRAHFGIRMKVPWREDFGIAFYETIDEEGAWGEKNLIDLPPGIGARTRPAISNAVDNSNFQVLAFSNGIGRVFHLTRTAGDFYP